MATSSAILRRQPLLLLSILVGLAAGQGVKEEAPFDLFLLVWTYSPGYCIKQAAKKDPCTVKPVSAFTLHGLWPEYEKKREVKTCEKYYKDQYWPECCETAKSPGPMPRDSDEMHCKWESFKGPKENPDAEFWGHEWDKHGTCAEPVLGSRPTYFETVLELDDKYDLDVALATYNITPSNTRSYAAVKLLNAVNDSYHASAVLDCGPDDVLVELRMCLSLDLEPIACPKHLKSTCGATVTLPEGNPVEAACRKYFPPPGQVRKAADLIQVAGAGVAIAGGRDSSSTGAGLQAEE